MNGNTGVDYLSVEDGANTANEVMGGKDQDTIEDRSNGRNTLNGNMDNDLIHVFSGSSFKGDTVYGGKGNDRILFESHAGGANTISGDVGNDTLILGDGRDTILFHAADNGADRVEGFSYAGGDRIGIPVGMTWSEPASAQGNVQIDTPTGSMELIGVSHSTFNVAWVTGT